MKNMCWGNFLQFHHGRFQENDDSVGWAWSMGLVRHGDAGDLDAVWTRACWAAAGGAHRAVMQRHSPLEAGVSGQGAWLGGESWPTRAKFKRAR
jgi:hypothetical protein